MEILRKQFVNSNLMKIEFTGYGFFVEFEASGDIQKTKKSDFQIDDVHLEVEELKYGIGFILFINNGIISELEGFTYGEEKFPDFITIKNLNYIYPDKKRNIVELAAKFEDNQ